MSADSDILEILDKAAFAELLQKNDLVVVDFFAVWCGPCKVIGPKFKELAGRYPTVTFAKVNVDDVNEVAEDCEISAMPTFQFYKNGSKVAEMKGANASKLEEEVKKLAGQ